MKRLLLALLVTICVQTGLPIGTARAAGVNDFFIQNYEIDYYLGRSDDKHSTLKTVETITAVFPSSDQNHGIERAIPSSYDGHSTHLGIDSIVDQNGREYPYTTRGSGDNTVVRIGDADTYVHGKTTYKLTYSQRDVTKFYEDTARDEFYWDTNGTDWRVPIQNLTARIHLDASIADAVTKNQRCYQGLSGSNEPCTIERAGDILTAKVSDLKPAQNVTIAVGFTANTFTPYKASTFELLAGLALLLSLTTIPIGIALIIWLVIRYQRQSNRSNELSTIIPEYIPPPDTSVTTAATISRKPSRSFSAQLIDLAVRHYIRIYETRKKSFWRSAKYELEIIRDIRDLKAEEKEILEDIFDSTQIGARLDMSTMKKNYTLAQKLSDNSSKLDKSIKGEYGLRARNEGQSRWFKRTGFITLAAAAITLSPVLLTASIISFVSGAILKPLTDKGLALARYLKGLEMYITVAETDRLRMLQSPEGALKIGGVDAKDSRQLVKLYERVLPYAILFGQEKEWNNRLGDYYQANGESPTWYNGNNTVFNAAVFSTAISNFNAAATYSNPSSSSSGGSGGGGSSGGGGGGGGGGGW